MATANLLQTSVSGGTANALALQGDGVFFPKASTASRLALTLTTTDKGFVVYDTTDSNIYFWNGTAWESIPGSGDAGANGSVQYNDNGTVSGATNFIYDKVTGLVTGVRYISTSSNAALPSFAVSAGNGIYNSGANQVGFAINGANAMTLNASGNLAFPAGTGIDFSATASGSGTMTSELLNDYEEGTWTGTLTGGTTNPTIPVTATGRYTKVGRVVTVQIAFSSVITTGASGIIGITGLPFANNSNVTSVAAGSFFSIATFTGSPFGNIGTNESFINFYSSNTNAAYGDVTHNAGTIRFLSASATYTVV